VITVAEELLLSVELELIVVGEDIAEELLLIAVEEDIAEELLELLLASP